MPETTRDGHAKKSELPSTIARSGAKAQRTFAKAHDAAPAEYGEGEHAHRVAYAALEHTHEKVGDRWEPKASPGASDATAEGVDASASRTHLYDVARRLDVRGRSRMTKDQLVDAIRTENRQRTRRAS